MDNKYKAINRLANEIIVNNRFIQNKKVVNLELSRSKSKELNKSRDKSPTNLLIDTRKYVRILYDLYYIDRPKEKQRRIIQSK